ncbi:hypothetical protein GLOTRDRAFT_133835 [Gloeophyllum trabeum ATCC 11539]|uniref:Uncharacterized protein n=1 Tax=Gloeophyllum trabeum (strain ATCC 11539 / FP-39264 / Madison 617) TaxID=670483 RepID=S7PTH8_GLOTA|nr:uncharacterized protein GLOTRDRAFT_133835 [Gloeophyllum trabeum ATCC 11539]EPQ50733.1 hypothetical protein GLOTRDRAFT_133835 [Gloeophyllum trabeum ATCC 11539]
MSSIAALTTIPSDPNDPAIKPRSVACVTLLVSHGTSINSATWELLETHLNGDDILTPEGVAWVLAETTEHCCLLSLSGDAEQEAWGLESGGYFYGAHMLRDAADDKAVILRRCKDRPFRTASQLCQRGLEKRDQFTSQPILPMATMPRDPDDPAVQLAHGRGLRDGVTELEAEAIKCHLV